MSDHDHNYKNLFSHAKMVEDLLKGFVDAEWVTDLDYSTLEKLNGSYITDDLRERSDDVVWRVKFHGQWLYIYLLLEFQSTVDPFMAVRMLTYVGLLYQDLIKTQQLPEKGKLPPVFSLVLYNGERPWKAATELSELLQPLPPGLQTWQPQLRYLLIDEGRYSLSELEKLDNLTAALIRAEIAENRDDLIRVIANLIVWLPLPQQRGLRGAFREWLNRHLLPRRLPGEKIDEVSDLTEIQTMLAERVKEWTKDWYDEGFKTGFEKGIEQGLEAGTKQGIKQGFMQGEALIVTRLLEKRFGCLPEWAKKKLNSASDEQLDLWSGRILEASNLEMALDDYQDLTEIYTLLAGDAHELMARWQDHGYKEGIEKGIEQGEAKGIELGCAEGVRQGEAHILARLLEKRFGPLPDKAKIKLDTANHAQLKIWSDKLINANSLDNFFEGNDKQGHP